MENKKLVSIGFWCIGLEPDHCSFRAATKDRFCQFERHICKDDYFCTNPAAIKAACEAKLKEMEK